jgi:hypothetical protein
MVVRVRAFVVVIRSSYLKRQGWLIVGFTLSCTTKSVTGPLPILPLRCPLPFRASGLVF